MKELDADIIANLTLYSKERGGRNTPISSSAFRGRFGCWFQYSGEVFDCFVLLKEGQEILPGQTLTVPIKFLRPDLIKRELRLGTKFLLREGKTIGEGSIREIYLNP